MPWNATTKQIQPLFAFLDQFQPGDPAMRSSFDAFLNDLVTSINAAVVYLESLAAGAIYLGEAAVPPTQRPDGSPLISGDFYLDTDDGILYRFDDQTIGWFPIVPPSGASAYVTSQVLPAETPSALRSVLELGSAATAESIAFQAANARLTAISALSPVEDRIAYFTGATTMALAPLTSLARSLLAAGNATSMRSVLGLAEAIVTASFATQADAEGGTNTSALMNPLRVKQAIDRSNVYALLQWVPGTWATPTIGQNTSKVPEYISVWSDNNQNSNSTHLLEISFDGVTYAWVSRCIASDFTPFVNMFAMVPPGWYWRTRRASGANSVNYTVNRWYLA